jgi:hypothetical protein
MSIANSTIFTSKFKSFFFNIAVHLRFAYGGYIFWPEGISYSSWQKLLKAHLCLIRNKPNRRRKLPSRYNKFLRSEIQQRTKIIQKQTNEIINEVESWKLDNNEEVSLELITMLKQFWERKHISKHIEETIPDHRNQDLITYSKQSIMMCALVIFLFRMESGNKYDAKSHDDDEKYSRRNMSKFIDAPEDRVPVIKTIEKFLKNLEEQRVNDLMIAFFKDLQHSKFFQQHPQIMPGDFFLLAADCVHTHTYDHPHHTDIHGNNDCDCCLKRVYNKGTENEKVKWFHNTLVFSFIFMGGLKIPIYRHPIHAKQIVGFESASEDLHKQECELIALKTAFPIIRQAFPRMKMVLLLDGLYANRPVIRLAEEHRCGYIIVRKESCLPLLAKECDEHASQPNHKKNCVKKSQRLDEKGWKIEQKYAWFNSMYLGEGVSTNVLRFWEERTREADKTKSYTCEWLFSWRLSAKTCELAARQARARWEVEDLFNTLKNRGHNLGHDYSRDPRSCFNWHGLALFAFGIFELFRFSEAVKQRGDWAQSSLAEKLLGQLLHRPTEELFSKGSQLKRIQFRYHFVVERIQSKEIFQNSAERELKTG